MRKYRDGWHKIAGHTIYVEDGMVKRGICGPSWSPVPCYPYRWSRKLHCWCNENMTVDAFRAGIRYGTVAMK